MPFYIISYMYTELQGKSIICLMFVQHACKPSLLRSTICHLDNQLRLVS